MIGSCIRGDNSEAPPSDTGTGGEVQKGGEVRAGGGILEQGGTVTFCWVTLLAILGGVWSLSAMKLKVDSELAKGRALLLSENINWGRGVIRSSDGSPRKIGSAGSSTTVLTMALGPLVS